ncbi:MAG: magnesium chelatase subunit H [Candidatus Methanodesulfokora sp.]
MKKLDITLITTKTTLKTLYEAAKRVEDESRVKLDLHIIYSMDFDKLAYENLANILTKADAILIDIRGGMPNYLEEAVEHSRARVIVPLVGGTGSIGFLRLGRVSGADIIRRMKSQDFDSDRVDINSIFRVINTIEKAGRLLPLGSLRHYKNWIWIMKYWTYWGHYNLENLFRLLLSEYFGIKLRYEEPKTEGELAVYDPDKGFLHVPIRPQKPAVALLLYAGMHFEQCLPVALFLRKELIKHDINVLFITGGVAESLTKQIEALKDYTMPEGERTIDAIINLQWFLLNGGPYGGPVEPTRTFLRDAGYLLFNGLIAYMRRVSEWQKDPRGLSPIEVITGVALPEVDGAIEPIISAGLDDSDYTDIIVLEERVKRKAERIARWIKLRYKPDDEKKLAVIIYNYPPGEHNVGSAAYLDTLGSLEVLLRTLADHGYRTVPLNKEKLRDLIGKYLANSPNWHQHAADIPFLSLDDYLKYYGRLPDELKSNIEKVWGPPPGTINTDEKGNLVIPGIILGNVFIGIQPSRGFHESPEKLYHSKDIPPHHQYIAFYYWVREIFGADVILHLGTHGTLELLPGKEVALSDICWPDVLIGSTPHVYVYHVTNPSEMTIAKRRSYAYIITHGTPPFVNADLYGEYSELEQLIGEFSDEQDPEKRALLEHLIREKCSKLNIQYEGHERLHSYLYELKRAVIPYGLHVLGEKWNNDDIVNYVAFVLRKDGDVPSLARLLLEEEDLSFDKVIEAPSFRHGDRLGIELLAEADEKARRLLARIVAGDSPLSVASMFRKVRNRAIEVFKYAHDLVAKIKSGDELEALIQALNGRYIEPRVAGDPIRTPEVFPVGSHGYAFDPRLIPSKAACIRGARLAENIVKRYWERNKCYPETIALVLWGFETAQTRGETVAMLLQLLGVKLSRDRGPWEPRLEVIPIEQLGRPRIDITATICGFFRDMFPNLIALIDEAVKMVANLDEPPEMNYVKKHYAEMKNKLGDMSLIRIFGPKPGTYGTRIPEFVEASGWSKENELTEVYLQDMAYGYGAKIHGMQAREFLMEVLRTVDSIAQVKSTNEYDITDLDHYYEFLGGLRKTVEILKGKKIEALWLDTTSEREIIKSTEEAIDFSVRTRLLNPKWIEGMLSHGYDGAREIAKRVEYLFGHAALTGGVSDWIWDRIAETYIFNESIRNRLIKSNPWALHEILRRLYEAHKRGYWKASEKNLRDLLSVSSEVEAIIESSGE